MRFRRWFLPAAIVLSWVIVVIELGSGAIPAVLDIVGAPTASTPGVGIAAMAFVDIPMAFTLTLFGLGMVVPHALIGRTQGCATLILGVLILLIAIVSLFVSIALLLLMLALVASFFGIAVYLATWGRFDRSAATTILAFLFASKLVIGLSLLLSDQGYLKNRGLIALWITTLVANVIVALLHGLVPRPAVSILDAVAAIILAIVGIVWAVLLLIGAIVSIVRVLQLGRRKLPEPGA